MKIFKDDVSFFRYIGAKERKEIESWLGIVKCETSNQQSFIKRVQIALDEVQYDFYIADIEPSQDENGKIYYKANSRFYGELSFEEWEKSAENFYCDDEFKSTLASLYEGDLLKAYKFAIGYWNFTNLSERYITENYSRQLFSLLDGYAVSKICYKNSAQIFESTIDYYCASFKNTLTQALGVLSIKYHNI